MSKSAQVSLKVAIGGSFATTANSTIDVEAYDVIEVTVPVPDGGHPTFDVTVAPGTADHVRLLMVTASKYGTDAKPLTFTVSGGADSIALDQPQLFAGQGAIGLLKKAPDKFTFTNGTNSSVDVTIVVGRKASS